MSKHKPTCRCVECDGNRTMRPGEQTGVVSLSWLRRLLREYRKAMRLLARHVAANEQPYCYAVEAALNKDIRDAIAKWREGK